jgi:hypothetical protein
MVKDFNIFNKSNGLIGYFRKQWNKIIFIRIGENRKGNVAKINPESLKEWLDEATKPRFRVKHDLVGYLVIDTENKYSVANFKECEHINAEKEAEKLCKELNEGE